MRALCVVLAVLLVTTACGQAADQASPANQPESGSDTPSTLPGSEPPSTIAEPTGPKTAPRLPVASAPTPVPEGAAALPRDQVDSSALPAYHPDPNVWALNGGRTLQLNAMARDACAGVQARVVEQSDTAVRIVLSPADAPQGGPVDGPGMCAQVLTPRQVTVDLKVPLGNRKVYISES